MAACVEDGCDLPVQQPAGKGQAKQRCPEHYAEHMRTWRREYMRDRREAQRANRPDKRCLECGNGFATSQGNVQYCSDECSRTARLRRRNAIEYQPLPISCQQCGGLIPYKSGKRRFCSSDCAKLFVAADARWKTKGLTVDHGMVEECGLCRRTDQRLDIDHDHRCCPGQRSCGKCVRGFLCRPCNVGLGMFGDDPMRLRAAASYIEQHPFLR